VVSYSLCNVLTGHHCVLARSALQSGTSDIKQKEFLRLTLFATKLCFPKGQYPEDRNDIYTKKKVKPIPSTAQTCFGYEGTWWRLFQKLFVRTKFDIYVFIKSIFPSMWFHFVCFTLTKNILTLNNWNDIYTKKNVKHHHVFLKWQMIQVSRDYWPDNLKNAMVTC
jgi:hypothetical protein